MTDRLRTLLRTLALTLAVVVVAGTTFSQEPVIGRWTDKGRTVVYTFSANNQFSFSRSPSIGTIRPLEGSWRSERDICWVDQENGKHGNLLISVETGECCLTANMSRGKLFISMVWEKGNGFGLCSNRVLERVK